LYRTRAWTTRRAPGGRGDQQPAGQQRHGSRHGQPLPCDLHVQRQCHGLSLYITGTGYISNTYDQDYFQFAINRGDAIPGNDIFKYPCRLQAATALTFTPGAQATGAGPTSRAGPPARIPRLRRTVLRHEQRDAQRRAFLHPRLLPKRQLQPVQPYQVYMSMIGSGFVHGDVVPVNSTATGKAGITLDALGSDQRYYGSRHHHAGHFDLNLPTGVSFLSLRAHAISATSSSRPTPIRITTGPTRYDLPSPSPYSRAKTTTCLPARPTRSIPRAASRELSAD